MRVCHRVGAHNRTDVPKASAVTPRLRTPRLRLRRPWSSDEVGVDWGGHPGIPVDRRAHRAPGIHAPTRSGNLFRCLPREVPGTLPRPDRIDPGRCWIRTMLTTRRHRTAHSGRCPRCGEAARNVLSRWVEHARRILMEALARRIRSARRPPNVARTWMSGCTRRFVTGILMAARFPEGRVPIG